MIFTSATLAAPSLDHYMQSSGIHQAYQMIAQSPFDYKRNAMLYVPIGDKPSPKQQYEFTEFVITNMRALVRASDGGAFLLFTSNRMMNDVSNALRYEFEDSGYTVYVQGELPKLEIAQRFRDEERAVLFGTKSFFEGVSIDGDNLRLVVVDKIPFEAPTPLGDAREEAATTYALNTLNMPMDKAKWYPFQSIRVPSAIIELKQGAGRLIRTKQDRGVIAILDNRMRTTFYGRKMIFPAMPPAVVTDSIRDVEEFFEYRRELMPLTPQDIRPRRNGAQRKNKVVASLFAEKTLNRDEDGDLWA